MWNAIKGLFSSKKFWMTVIGSVVCAAMKYFGVSDELILTVAGFFGLNILGQGLADLGKEKK